MKKDLLRNNKGISMIALIITILVMLILAVVAFTVAGGEDGVVNKAESAKVKQIKAKIEEVTDIASNAVLFEDDNFKKYNEDYWESCTEEEKQDTLKELELMFDGDPAILFLGKMNMQTVHQEVSNMLKNEIEKNDVKVDGYFNISGIDELLGEEFTDKTNIEKYEEVYKQAMEAYNNPKYDTRFLGFLIKMLYLDQYIVTVEYEGETWKITSNGKGLIPEYVANDFEFDTSDRLIGYIGKDIDVTLPTIYMTRYVNEIGKKSTTGYRDSDEPYFYNENYWSPFVDKEMRLTGIDAFESELNKDFFDMMYALVTENLPEPGENATEDEKSKYETQQEIKEYFTIFGNPTTYDQFLANIYAKHYDSNNDGKLDDTDDIYFYAKVEGETIKFLPDTTQTVEIIRVPEIKDDMKKYIIYPYAFAGDSKLKHVYLPASLFERNNGKIKYNSETIGYNAFEGSHPDLIIHIETPEGWTEEDKATAESTIRGLNDAKYDEEEGYTISWE